MESFRRLLCCLKYPFHSTVDLSARPDRIHLVTWLEDSIIRLLENDERAVLRNYSDVWDAAFSGYLNNLGCPFEWGVEPSDCLHWMIGYAVDEEYQDSNESNDAKENREDGLIVMTESNENNESNGSNQNNENNENDMAVDEESGPQGDSVDLFDVDSIGSLLGLSRIEKESNPDYLQRISKVIRLTLTAGSLEALRTNNEGGIPLEAFPLGFNTGDKDINQIATVLKMLYLADFRELQNDLNELIALGQGFTKNTKTNPALGRVGR